MPSPCKGTLPMTLFSQYNYTKTFKDQHYYDYITTLLSGEPCGKLNFPFPFLNILLFSPKFLTVPSPLCLVFDILLTNPHQNFNHISKIPLITLRCTKYSINSTLGKKSLPGPSDASWEHSCHAGISHCRT